MREQRRQRKKQVMEQILMSGSEPTMIPPHHGFGCRDLAALLEKSAN